MNVAIGMKKIAKFNIEWPIKCALLEFYLFLLDLENHKVLASTFIASLNFLSSLSKIFYIYSSLLPYFYLIFFLFNVKMAKILKDDVMLIKNSNMDAT